MNDRIEEIEVGLAQNSAELLGLKNHIDSGEGYSLLRDLLLMIILAIHVF